MAAGVGCSSGSGKPKATGGPATAPVRRAGRTLRIAQWNNYVAGYDQWWDNEYTKRWGERNGIEVLVDHFDINQAPAHAEAEPASQRGTTSSSSTLRSPAPFEDDVIDHREIVEEVEAKLGKMTALRRAEHLQPQDGEVLRLLRLLGPEPGPLPNGSLGPLSAAGPTPGKTCSPPESGSRPRAIPSGSAWAATPRAT